MKFIFLGMTIDKSSVSITTYFVLLFNFAVYPLKASLQIFIYWLSAPDISIFNLYLDNIKLLKIRHLTNSFMLTLVNLTH